MAVRCLFKIVLTGDTIWLLHVPTRILKPVSVANEMTCSVFVLGCGKITTYDLVESNACHSSLKVSAEKFSAESQKHLKGIPYEKQSLSQVFRPQTVCKSWKLFQARL